MNAGEIMVCDVCGANLELGECSEAGEWWLNCPEYEFDQNHRSELVKYVLAE